MARNEQLIRQLRLIHILENARFGKTLAELRDAVIEDLGLDGISERTVRRDLEALQAAGLDLGYHSEERGSVWKVGPRLESPPQIVASAAELLALSMGRELLAPLAGTPFWIGIETLWTKMRESLPESVWKHFEEQRSSIVVRGSPLKSYSEKKGILSTLNRAIQQRRAVAIVYRSASDDSPRPREIEPYATVFYRGSLYVVAALKDDPSDKPLRHWKLDRFVAAEITDRRFSPRSDFNASKHFQNSLGVYNAGPTLSVCIRISPEAALWVTENPWSNNQHIRELPDGGVELQLFDVYESEILPRVLALANAAEVIEPKDFRERIRKTLDQMRNVYSRDPPAADL